MSKIFGEAIQDTDSGKWGIKTNHEDGSIITEPDFIFDSQESAEAELIKSLKELGELAKPQ